MSCSATASPSHELALSDTTVALHDGCLSSTFRGKLECRGGVKISFSRGKKTIRDILARLRWQRRQAELRKELWLQSSRGSGPSHDAKAIVRLHQEREAAELLLAQLPLLVWRDRATRIRLPSLCGSRPYFPAAPP